MNTGRAFITFVKHAAFAGLVIFMTYRNAICVPPKPREISAEDRTILGITLGSSTTKDITRVFGPAATKENSNWFDPVEFRLMHGNPVSSLSCSKSTLISAEMATGSGLRLGLDRSQVIAILGHPDTVKRSRFIYESSYDRPLTPSEADSYKTGSPPWKVTAIHVDDRIKIDFRRSKVASIDVFHEETD